MSEPAYIVWKPDYMSTIPENAEVFEHGCWTTVPAGHNVANPTLPWRIRRETVTAPSGGKHDEPANPTGLDKPTQRERADLQAGRVPDLLYLQSQIGKAIRRMARPPHGATPSDADIASAAALKRLHDAAVRECANDLQRALDMHGGK